MEYVTTVKSRELGEGLRRVLAAAGLSGKEVADQLGWTPPDVAKMLNGRRARRETQWVLRLPVGGAEVMSDQLHHLLRMSVRPRISLRVVPAAVGAHAGIVGSFIFMEFAEIKPVVYLESETTASFLEEDEEITAYRRII